MTSWTRRLKAVATYDGKRGDRIDLPESAFIHFNQKRWDVPYVFEFCKPNARRSATPKKPAQIYTGGAMMFNAKEGCAHVPHWILEEIDVEEGEQIEVKLIRPAPKKATSITLQPYKTTLTEVIAKEAGNNDFARESDVLNECMRGFACLRKGNNVVIEWKGKEYKLQVVDLKPKDTATGAGVSASEVKIGLNMLPPKDAKQQFEKKKEEIEEEKMAKYAEDIWSDDEDEKKMPKAKYVCGTCFHPENTKKAMLTHQSACEMINYRCTFPGCGACVKRVDEEKHRKIAHEIITCECGLKIMQVKLEGHQKSRCASRTACPFCGVEKRIRGYFQHVKACGDREQICQKCGEVTTVRKIVFGEHDAECKRKCKCGQMILPKNQDAHDKYMCPYRIERCRWCHKKVQARNRFSHEEKCPLNRRANRPDTKGGTPSSPSTPRTPRSPRTSPASLKVNDLMAIIPDISRAQAETLLRQANGNVGRAVQRHFDRNPH
mmetsp:Transcript_18148/g.27233  ORF Transcript_18148/g.27233 Transcript_18148/m.27233 type:complete len:491 (+) Transcript_18148:2-1474(+)